MINQRVVFVDQVSDAVNISVVIPTLNEEAHIAETLRSVSAQSYISEIIVVDGGSVDATVEIAAPHAILLHAGQSRAEQMNAGATRATGDVLLFVHADTVLTPHHTEAIAAALHNPDVVGGCAPIQFDADTPLLNCYSFLSTLTVRSFHYGDGAIFVRREVFERMGGYAPIAIMEDFDFLKRLEEHGTRVLLPIPVVTSARRFLQGGTFRTQAKSVALVAMFIAGVHPTKIKQWYSYDRRSTT